MQDSLGGLLTLAGVDDPLQDREVVQHLERRDLRVNAELLRQVAEGTAHRVLLLQYVEAAEPDGAAVGLLQRREGPHQGRFPGAVRSQKAEHAGGDPQRHVAQRLHAVRIGLRKIVDDELRRHVRLPPVSPKFVIKRPRPYRSPSRATPPGANDKARR